MQISSGAFDDVKDADDVPSDPFSFDFQHFDEAFDEVKNEIDDQYTAVTHPTITNSATHSAPVRMYVIMLSNMYCTVCIRSNKICVPFNVQFDPFIG